MTTVNYEGYGYNYTTEGYFGSPSLTVRGITTVNFDTPPQGGYASTATIDTSPGSITTINANSAVEGFTTLNLSAGSITTVNGTMYSYEADVNGSPGSILIDNGTIESAFSNISGTVLGNGTIEFMHWGDGPGSNEVSGFSGSGLTYDVGGNTTINDPHSFFSQVNFSDDWPEVQLNLAGLSATSDDLKNDLLTLYQGNAAVYQLRLNASPGFVVQDYAASGGVQGGVSLTYYPNGVHVTGLPQHTTGA